MEKIKVLGIVGSLRKNSYNKALMRAAVEEAPEFIKIEVFDIAGVPVFNQDLEYQPPPIVRDFKTKIRAADAILFASPEYNYSIPGVLKNAIDWASRPHGDNAFAGKPTVIMSASISKLGGARAQYHMRQSFVYLNMHAVNTPEVMLAQAQNFVDEDGVLRNEATRKLIRQLLEELGKWTLQLKAKL